jgi:hypothetical protein
MIAATVAVMASLLVAQAVAAASEDDGVREKFPNAPVTLVCPAILPFVCVGPSPGNMAVVPIRISKKALPIERLCVTFRFEGDLLDPGEGILFTFSLDPLASAFGLSNIGTVPQSERTVCLVAGFHDEELAMLAATKKPTLILYMDPGSATVVDLEVSILPQ